jgi:hypothetical protein
MGIEKMSSKTRIFLAVLFALIVLVVYNNIYTKKTSGPKLQALVQEFNKKCPRMINNEQRLEQVIALSNNRVGFCYTMLEINLRTSRDRDLSGDKLKNVLANVKNQIREGKLIELRRAAKNHKFDKMSYTAVEIFKDVNGERLFEIEIQPNEYR